ncbi:MAG: nucleotidyltransferase domain-containing protein [Nanoarchaeota archaeon]
MITFQSLNLEKYQYEPQYISYLSSLNKFLTNFLPKIKHTHVFLTGSFIKGKLHEGSDLDLDIVHPDIKETEVIKINIDGVNIEYATFSLKMIEKKISGEIHYDHPDLLANAVSHWKMIAGDYFPSELVDKERRFKKISSLCP